MDNRSELIDVNCDSDSDQLPRHNNYSINLIPIQITNAFKLNESAMTRWACLVVGNGS